MRATLAVLASEPGRKLAVLGEMRELGEHSDAFPRRAGRADRGRAASAMSSSSAKRWAHCANALEGRLEFVHVPDAATARERLHAVLAPGDAVLVKGSNGVRLSTVVAALAERAMA